MHRNAIKDAGITPSWWGGAFLGLAWLLSGCAGVSSDLGCNATTSDSCMTMQQANEKAKRVEEGRAAKPAAAALPRLAEGDFAAIGREGSAVPVQDDSASRLLPRAEAVSASASPSLSVPAYPVKIAQAPIATTVSTCTLARCSGVGNTHPVRNADRTAELWIAPWIDGQDVYHQPGKVVFVVRPAAWGQPRIAQ